MACTYTPTRPPAPSSNAHPHSPPFTSYPSPESLSIPLTTQGRDTAYLPLVHIYVQYVIACLHDIRDDMLTHNVILLANKPRHTGGTPSLQRHRATAWKGETARKAFSNSRMNLSTSSKLLNGNGLPRITTCLRSRSIRREEPSQALASTHRLTHAPSANDATDINAHSHGLH